MKKSVEGTSKNIFILFSHPVMTKIVIKFLIVQIINKAKHPERKVWKPHNIEQLKKLEEKEECSIVWITFNWFNIALELPTLQGELIYYNTKNSLL